MALVLKLAPLDQPGAQRLGRCLALQGLDAGHFIRTDDMRAHRLQQRRIRIQGTDCLHLLGEGDGIRLSGVQPVAAAMGLEIGLSLRSARPNGLKWR